MLRIRQVSVSHIVLEDSLLIIILNLVCRGALEGSLLIVALILILLVMKIKGHVLNSVLECFSRKIVHDFACLVAHRCNSLIAFFTAVFQTAMVNADNTPIIRQTDVLAYALLFRILLLITPPTPV